jgi:uncharacterized membrane protein YdjX (TVP38/TMEM64 family)
MSKKAILLLVALALVAVGIGLFFLLQPGIWRIFTSREAFQEYINGFGFWGPVVFFLIQIAQIIVSPIPGNITTLVGGAIFGIWFGFLLSGSAMIVGSLIAFYLARTFGQGLVIRLVGRRLFERYNHFFTGRFSATLFLLFIIPFFPDDALCYLAGLSTLPTPIFILFLVVGRLPSVLVSSLVGDGVLVLEWWQWVLVGIVSLGIVAVFFKYGDKLEEKLRLKMLARKERVDS